MPVLLVVSLLGFIGSVAVARYVGGMLLRSSGSGEDVGLPQPAERAAGGGGADLPVVLDVVALACLLAGALLCLTAGLGLVRFPDVLSRMHAGTKPQVLRRAARS